MGPGSVLPGFKKIIMRLFKIIVVILLFPLFSHCQLSEYNLIREIGSREGEPKIIYLTATWCKPCMDKLKLLMENFGKKEQFDFIVLFDRNGFTDRIYEKLKTLY